MVLTLKKRVIGPNLSDEEVEYYRNAWYEAEAAVIAEFGLQKDRGAIATQFQLIASPLHYLRQRGGAK